MRRRAEVTIAYDDAGRAFEAAHHSGAEEFKQLWIAVNDSAVQSVGQRADYSHPAMKELMSGLLLRTLRTMRERGFLKSFPPKGVKAP